MKYIYLCSREIAKQLGFVGKKKENHSHHTSNNITYFWPNNTNNRTINPTSINRIKEDYKIKDIDIILIALQSLIPTLQFANKNIKIPGL